MLMRCIAGGTQGIFTETDVKHAPGLSWQAIGYGIDRLWQDIDLLCSAGGYKFTADSDASKTLAHETL